MGLDNGYTTLQCWYANQWFAGMTSRTKSGFTFVANAGTWLTLGY